MYVLSNTLKLLHPFMPFITEEIWQTLPHDGESIMVSAYPEYDEALCFRAEQTGFEKLMEAIKAVRNRRAEMNVPPSKKAHLFIATADEATFTQGAVFFTRLASASEVSVGAGFEIPDCVSVVTADATVYMPLAELIDIEKEKARLAKELKAAEDEEKRLAAKLANPGFVSKAPEAVVAAEREKLEKLGDKLDMIRAELAKLG